MDRPAYSSRLTRLEEDYVEIAFPILLVICVRIRSNPHSRNQTFASLENIRWSILYRFLWLCRKSCRSIFPKLLMSRARVRIGLSLTIKYFYTDTYTPRQVKINSQPEQLSISYLEISTSVLSIVEGAFRKILSGDRVSIKY